MKSGAGKLVPASPSSPALSMSRIASIACASDEILPSTSRYRLCGLPPLATIWMTTT